MNLMWYPKVLWRNYFRSWLCGQFGIHEWVPPPPNGMSAPIEYKELWGWHCRWCRVGIDDDYISGKIAKPRNH